MEQSLITGFAAHGLPGLIILALGAYVIFLHKELRAEREERNKESKAYTETMIAFQRESFATSKALAEVNEDMKERQKEQDRSERERREQELRDLRDQQDRARRRSRENFDVDEDPTESTRPRRG